MNVSDKMFGNSLVFGNYPYPEPTSLKKEFLDLNSNGITIVDNKPKVHILHATIETFTNCKTQIAAELNKHSFKEVLAFTRNIFYALEKQPELLPWKTVHKIATIGSVLFVSLASVIYLPSILLRCSITADTCHTDELRSFICSYISYAQAASWMLGIVIFLPRLETFIEKYIPNPIKINYIQSYEFAKASFKLELRPWSQLKAYQSILAVVFPILKKKCEKFEDNKVLVDGQGNFRRILINEARDLISTDRTWNILDPYVKYAKWMWEFESTMQDFNQTKGIFRKFLRKKWKMQKDYFIVIHGQSLQWAPIVDFNTAVAKRLKNESGTNFKYLRCHKEERLLSSQINQFFHDNREKFLKRTFEDGKDNNLNLLSVSINPWDRKNGESALSFWTGNGNIYSAGSYGKIDKDRISATLGLEDDTTERIAKKLSDLGRKLKENNKTRWGNLYAICLPKFLVANPNTTPFYVSKPFGIPVDIDNPRGNIAALRNKVDFCSPPLQGRCFTLTPEDGVQIFRFNGIPRSVKQEYYKEIDALVDEVIPLMDQQNTPSII